MNQEDKNYAEIISNIFARISGKNGAEKAILSVSDSVRGSREPEKTFHTLDISVASENMALFRKKILWELSDTPEEVPGRFISNLLLRVKKSIFSDYGYFTNPPKINDNTEFVEFLKVKSKN